MAHQGCLVCSSLWSSSSLTSWRERDVDPTLDHLKRGIILTTYVMLWYTFWSIIHNSAAPMIQPSMFESWDFNGMPDAFSLSSQRELATCPWVSWPLLVLEPIQGSIHARRTTQLWLSSSSSPVTRVSHCHPLSLRLSWFYFSRPNLILSHWSAHHLSENPQLTIWLPNTCIFQESKYSLFQVFKKKILNQTIYNLCFL